MLKNILRGAGKDALTYFPVRLVPALTSLVTVPVFTRMIGPEAMGAYNIVMPATSLAATVSTAWISNAAVRFYWPYEKQGRQDDYTATALWSTAASVLAVSALFGLGTLALRGRMPDAVVALVPVALAALCVNYFVTVCQQMLRAANRSRDFAMVAVSANLLITAFAVAFVAAPQFRWGAFGIMAGTVAGNLLILPFALRRVASEGSLSPVHVRRDVLGEFVRYGLPMVPAAVSSWMLVLSDRYVLGAYSGLAIAGLYAVAYSLGDKIMQLVQMPLLTTMGPVMIQTWEKDGQRLAQQVQTQFTRYFLMAQLPVVFGLAAAARPFMEVFTGDRYHEAWPVLPVVAAGVMLYGLTQVAGNGIALHKKTTITMTNTLAAAVLNIGLNIVLIPRFGYMAAAWDTVAAYLFLLALTWARSRPYLAWEIPWADVARVLAAALGMYAAVHFTLGRLDASAWLLLAEAAAGLAVYALLLLAVGALRADERDFLRDAVRSAFRRGGAS
ncbi:MAG: hypothetical protein C0418_03050 [Coriobacteriaceae bacterium]|nr:hypothetical protein [Coriobacteriaceae bacterium]